MLYALLLGVALHYLNHEASIKTGIEFFERIVLRLVVGLLRACITAAQIVGLDWGTELTVIAASATTVLCALVVGKRLGMTPAQRVLSGGAVTICGASATLAMVLYPLIARVLNLPDYSLVPRFTTSRRRWVPAIR